MVSHSVQTRYYFEGFEKGFTELEWKVIIGLAYGLKTKEIALKINRSYYSTVNKIVRIKDILGLSTRMEIMVWYFARRKVYMQRRNNGD